MGGFTGQSHRGADPLTPFLEDREFGSKLSPAVFRVRAWGHFSVSAEQMELVAADSNNLQSSWALREELGLSSCGAEMVGAFGWLMAFPNSSLQRVLHVNLNLPQA